jgi:hypothetical protein
MQPQTACRVRKQLGRKFWKDLLKEGLEKQDLITHSWNDQDPTVTAQRHYCAGNCLPEFVCG